MSVANSIPPSQEIFDDLACAACKYALRGLPTDHTCPECGTPISESLRMHSAPRQSALAVGLLTVAGLGLIAVVTWVMCAPRMFIHPVRSNPHRTVSQVASIAQQVNLYLLDYNLSQAPPTMTLEHLTLGPDPYLRPRDLLDPWGNPCRIVIPGKTNPDFDIVSLGADGKPGGAGDNSDIVN